MSRKGPRIVKGRTAKQRAAATRFGRSGASAILIIPKALGLPKRSWWTEARRDGFTEIARREAERMKLSMFGTNTSRALTDDGR